MLGDRAAIGGGQGLLIVNDVEERFVDLSDVMKERHALDALALVLREIGGLAENERVGGDAAHMGPRFRVVGVDRVEDGLQCGGSEALGSASGLLAADQHCGGGGSGRAGTG